MLSRFSCVCLFATLWTAGCRAPLSMGFSRQDYWSELSCPSPGNLPDPGIKPASPVSPTLAGGVFTTSATWEALFLFCRYVHLCLILDSTYKWYHMVFVFFWLTLLGMISISFHVAINGIISFFYGKVIFHHINRSVSSVTQSSLTLCDPMDSSTPGFPVLDQLPKLAQTHVHLVCDAIQPSHPLSSPSPPALDLSQHQGLFKWVSSSHQVVKVWSFSFSISPFNEYSGLMSFRMDWFDLLAVQGTIKSLLQHHISKESILRCSAFFIVQLSHPYMTTGKTIALTRRHMLAK